LPWDSRDEAAQDFVSAFKISTKNYNAKLKSETERLRAQGLKGKRLKEMLIQNVRRPEMKLKCKKKKRTESFFIRYRDWNQKGSCAWLKQIKTREAFTVNYDKRVIKDSMGRYYLIVPKPLEVVKPAPNHFEKIISLDPGVRTFLTGFDREGRALKFGENGMNVIFKHLYRADKINSSINKKERDGSYKYNHKRRQNGRKAMRRLLCKVKDKVKDAHQKISKYLCENYDAVLLPRFNTKCMIKKSDRKIKGKAARQMCTWSHFRFQEIINAKAKRYGCLIVSCTEYYTSKTCSHCGYIDHQLKGEREYMCKSCTSILDRDINAAKNILLKYWNESVKSSPVKPEDSKVSTATML
jgi:putative transposase